ncbi:DUF4388 domain-containing protein [Acidobacteriota bacterium]
MENIWLHGKLDDMHFSELLSHIWRSERSGRLEIAKEDQKRSMDFFEGQVVLVKDSLDKKLLLKIIVEKGLATESSLKKFDKIIADNNLSLMKAMLEESFLPPVRLWECLSDYQRNNLFPVFDWEGAEYFFDPDKPIHKHEILSQFPTSDLILLGIRQMTNETLIQSLSPEDNKSIEILTSEMTGQTKLTPPEEYLLSLIESQKVIRSIYAMSELGKRETQKIMLSFFNLGLVGFPEKKKTGHTSQEISKTEIYGIMDAFNEKCSYIFKYISKEIGPVALNILEKCIEDTKPLLSPILAKARLTPDGKIETNSVVKGGIALSGEEIKAQLLPGLNEILVALVLAVKRTLGNEHEAMLVKNMKKIGEWN